jgi:hypothetical protein
MRPGNLAGLDHLDAHQERVRRRVVVQAGIAEQNAAPCRETFFEHVTGFEQFFVHHRPPPKIGAAARPRTADGAIEQILINPLTGHMHLGQLLIESLQ